MKIDLHVHTSTGSDGSLSVEEVLAEAGRRNIGLLSVTDHDSVYAQEKAIVLAGEYGISYITGIELSIIFQYPGGKPVSLDFLGYGYDIHNKALNAQLKIMREHREDRARRILEKLNDEFDKDKLPRFTGADLRNIQAKVDGAFGRPHIADYLVARGLVQDRQEAFDRYLVRCDVPKYPLSLEEASKLVRNAGGILVHAHPADPHGTSLISISPDLSEQTGIIEKYMLDYIDGVECWHSSYDEKTTAHYVEFAKKHGLVMTGGSDCHQKPILLGTMAVPDCVAERLGGYIFSP